jgi:hypothetical protein
METVRPDWLRSVGYTDRPKERPTDDVVLVSPEGETGHHLFWSENRDGFENNTWHYGADFLSAVNLRDQPTRSDVRTLHRVLGIPSED